MTASSPTPEPPAHPRPDYPRDPLSQVCSEVAGLFRRAWGRGPVKTSAQWCGPSAIVVLLENGHTEAEKTMRAAGHIQELLGGRQLLQMLLEEDLTTAVERIVRRPVITMLSATRLDPDMSAEIFLLGPDASGSDSADTVHAAVG
jgi:uncharacterized protein YbcI